MGNKMLTVPVYQLAMVTLGLMGGGTFMAMGGSKVQKATQAPPINAQSPDEESFIK